MKQRLGEHSVFMWRRFFYGVAAWGGAALATGSLMMRISIFTGLVLLTFWMFVNIVQLAGGKGMTAPFDGFGAASSLGPNAGMKAGSATPGEAGPASDAAKAASAAIAREPDRARELLLASFPHTVGVLSVLFALCGALGATLHALGSLVAFAGNGKFSNSWSLWYSAQPLRGAVLAAGFFWLVQGGLLGGIGQGQLPVNGLAMMGATFLVGLFSDPAIEKLREVFEVLFRTAQSPRKNALAGRKPAIAAVTFDAARPALMTIRGSRFEATDQVLVNGVLSAVSAGRTDKVLDVQLPGGLAAAGIDLRVLVLPTQAGDDPSNVFATTTP